MTIAETRQAMAAKRRNPQSKHAVTDPKLWWAPAETHSTGHKQGRVATFPGRSTADHGWNTAEQGRNTADHGRNTADHGRNTADHGRNTADHR